MNKLSINLKKCIITVVNKAFNYNHKMEILNTSKI